MQAVYTEKKKRKEKEKYSKEAGRPAKESFVYGHVRP